MNPVIHSKTPRGLKSLIALVVVCFGMLMSNSLAQKVELDERHNMPLINTGSGKCFEPTPQGGASDLAGLPIQQRTCSPRVIRPDDTIDRPIQYYQFQSQGPVAFNDQGWFPCWGCIPNQTTGYLIRNLDTNLCLDARDGARTDGSVIQQWTCRDRNARSMVWYVEPGDFPYMFKVRNFNSDLCLDVRGGSSNEYAQLQQYRCTLNNLAQNFSQKFPAFWPVVDLNGRWTDGSTRSAVIYAGLGSIVIDMSAFGRPAARGLFYDAYFITVNFSDDARFTGRVTPTQITWSNGSVWTKKP
jgi:hypothetical protein